MHGTTPEVNLISQGYIPVTKSISADKMIITYILPLTGSHDCLCYKTNVRKALRVCIHY